MGRLKILGSGKSSQAQAQARGKLFESLMAQVLRFHGYAIDRIPNVNYAGMEIDIEGRASVTGIPLYAECKCYDTEIRSPQLQAFFGKYMALWLEERRCQGLFIALPGINSHAKAFYRERCAQQSEITVRLLEEEQILEVIFQTRIAVRPEIVADLITPDVGTAGDWLLLYTDKGVFWAQYIIYPGGGVPSAIALFDAMGKPLSDKNTLDYLTQLHPEFADFDRIDVAGDVYARTSSLQYSQESVVEVRGSSECFEYQFPASPEYFVGRHSVLEEINSVVTKVLDKETSSRGILLEANSGWGKSSTVLSSVSRLVDKRHFAVAIDSRSASTSQFLLRVIDHCFNKFGDFGGVLTGDHDSQVITGFEGAVRTLIDVGKRLESEGKILLIFFDQFENVFFLPDVLRRLTDLLLKLCDTQTNVILGFSWKTDLVGPTREFPYQLRDAIIGSSRRITLDTFSEVKQ
jgi:hypothetical protein